MKRFKKLIILCLCIGLLLSGCGKESAQEESTIQDLTPIYLEAVTNLNTSGNFTLTIQSQKDTTVGNEAFRETRQQTIRIQNYGTEQITASVDETVTIGVETYDTVQHYSQGRGYLTIGDMNFSAPIDSDDFLSQFAPAILMNIANYAAVTAEETEDGFRFTFSEANAPESWAASESAILASASGYCTIDTENHITAGRYSIEYTDSPATVSMTTDVTISYQGSSITLPDPANYKEISSLLAPQYLEAACCYLKSSNALTSSSTYNIHSEAFGVERSQKTQLSMSGSEDTFEAYIETEVQQQDYSSDQEPVHASQIVHYNNHQYTVQPAVADEIDQTAITWEDMQTRCRDILLGNILPSAHIADAALSDSAGYLLLTFKASEEMSASVVTNASQALYGESNFIASISTDIKPSTTDCFLAINKKTGLPTASGFTCETTHTIDNTAYPLSAQFNQTYYLANISSGAADSSAASAPIKPLFYQISDDSGTRMWLLVTTAYGDSRTANLPQAVYDALTGSQILLTEYEYDTNPNRLGASADTDAYNRGSTTAGFEAAKYYMQVSGNLSKSANERNGAYWSAVIADHAVEQNYKLSHKDSIFNQILQYAAPSEKKIEVLYPDTSTIQFTSKLSADAQDFLLTQTVTDLAATAQREYAIYDALCSGDAATIAKLLTFDSETETELADEYMQTVITDPSTQITDKLETYLQGSEITFAVIDVRYLVLENNVIAQLMADGYTVSQVEF